MAGQYSGRLSPPFTARPLSATSMPPRRILAAVLLVAAALARADDLADVKQLQAAGELPQALERARQAAEPRPMALRFLEGVILLDLKRDAEALAVFRRLTEDYPELPDPYNNIALIEARAGHLEQARLALETALRNDPSHVLARANLGEIHLRLAAQAFERAASAAPGDAALQRRLRLVRELLAAGR